MQENLTAWEKESTLLRVPGSFIELDAFVKHRCNEFGMESVGSAEGVCHRFGM
jgi:acetyl-CoA carboxylase carboxyltransferase component